MLRVNRQLVTDELSLKSRNNWLKTAGKSLIILDEFIEYTPNLIKKKIGGCQHVTGW